MTTRMKGLKGPKGKGTQSTTQNSLTSGQAKKGDKGGLTLSTKGKHSELEKIRA